MTRRPRAAIVPLLAACSALLMASTPALPSRPVEAAPIRDSAGRTHYIVDLREEATRGFAKLAPPADGFPNWHKAETRNLIQRMKQEHGFTPTAMTSLVGSSFSAYLTEEQVERLRKDSRVLRITPDAPVELSAVWTNTPSGSETVPWGVQAVGGGASSNGTVTVYVLDTGVAPHADLPNVAERLSATGQSPIGCYAHSTHVAGIIGAVANGSGVVGVNPGVRIVSVAVGDQPGNGCSNGISTSGVNTGLDLIKSRITTSGRVGIVNISMNGSLFRLGQTTGDKLANLATPSGGYPGAFIAESAGNQYSDACQNSYNGASSGDGIMVVGAIDANGQPVVPLNGNPGFQNMPYASNETGSNYGSCVEVWAPGKAILSTWTSPSHVLLSGTSMAAPHVSGLASYLAEVQGLLTPQQIEQAVRAHMVSLWGSSATIPNLNYQSRYAEPTVEFSESNQPVGYFEKFHTESITTFRYESIGASYCNLRGFMNGSAWYNVDNFVTAYAWPPSSLIPSRYRWTLDCVSPYGVHGGTEASAWIKRQVTKAAWVASSASTGYAEVETENGQFNWTATGPLNQRYVSENADYCEVQSYGYYWSPYWSRTLLWQSGAYYPTALNFGQFYLGDPHTAASPLGPYDGYYWQLRCWNSDGGERYGSMWGTMVN